MISNQWHAKTIQETEKALATSTHRGLSSEEAENRLQAYGFNRLQEKKRTSPLKLLLSQFNDFMVWVLLAAALISGLLLKEATDALAITAILVINALLGFRQEYKAERTLEELKKLTAPTAKVIRSGVEEETPAERLVPGDLILLEAGDHIPADARLIEATALLTNEAPLTGESTPVRKFSHETKEGLPLGERNNLVYLGTMINAGRGRALVYATGSKTEMGQISTLIQTEEEKTPLQVELKKVGKGIALLCLGIAAFIFAIGWGIRGYALAEIFLVAVALAVAAIPEGLPAIITVSLALGVQKMANKNAIVRKLHAVETLGATTVICTDKTGTLTENKMTLGKVYIDGQGFDLLKGERVLSEETLKELLLIAVLCNDARRGKDNILIGDPTETALLEAAEKFGLEVDALRRRFPRASEIPFDSHRKEMTTIHSVAKRYNIFVKGAPERVLSQSTHYMQRGEQRPLDEKEQKNLAQIASNLATEGYRVLAFAKGSLTTLPDESELPGIERDLTIIGFGGLLDPPRPEVPEALSLCQKAGIKVAMVTGDHLLTAQTVAKQIGLLKEQKILTGVDLEKLTEEELAKIVEDIAVYARVAPAHKVKIINALRSHQHIVAMTGDGVNDAPAVKRADIGVAMGVVGTDVTKEAADMVLADDNFATIVAAVKEGRQIFDNLKKFILFLLSCNISEVLTLFTAIVVPGLPLPLRPVQILWINLITDGFPALALGVDPPLEDLMERKPRKQDEGVLAPQRQRQIAWRGTAIALGVLLIFILSVFWFKLPLVQTQTIVFSTMVLGQLFQAFHFRSEKFSIFSRQSLTNPFLLWAVLASLLLQVLITYVPWFQPFFHTAALDIYQWGLVLLGAFIPVLLVEATKTKRLVQ